MTILPPPGHAAPLLAFAAVCRTIEPQGSILHAATNCRLRLLAVIHDAFWIVDRRNGASDDDVAEPALGLIGHREIAEVRIVDKDEAVGRDQPLELWTGIGAGIDPRGEGGRAKGHHRQ